MRFIKLTTYAFILIAFFGLAQKAQATANVYYSVGQSTDNLETGAGNVTVSGTTATFTVAQTGNIGVGDVVDYDSDNKKCYLAGKTSTSVWSCVSATGGTPTAASGVVVNSIKRVYTSLTAAEAGATDSSHINNVSLVAADVILNLPCYYDSSADAGALFINGYTTDATRYIKIYTPNNPSTEVNQSQRHTGKWDDAKFKLETDSTYAIQVSDEYVKIEGLQMKVSHTTANGHGIYITSIATGGSVISISNNLIAGVFSGGAYTGNGIYGNDSDAVLKINNNIIYDWVNGTGNMYGISVSLASTTSYLYNNTLVDNYQGMRSPASPGGAIAINNIVKGSGDTGAFMGVFTSGSDYNATDGTDTTITSDHHYTSRTFVFVDETGNDFHLSSIDTGAKGAGTNLYADASLAVTNDIDSAGRPNASSALSWDIGADQVLIQIYRSVAPEATSVLANGATNPLNISDSTVTFNSALPDNIGVGDVLEYDDDNDGDIDANDSLAFITGRTSSTIYTIKKVDGSAPQAPSAADEIHWNINRAYASLYNAERGVENTSIDSDLRNFDDWTAGGTAYTDDVGKDIMASNEQWNIVCYANGTTADSTNLSVSGWITGENNYLSVYTPTSLSEVGISQRHSGKWDDTKYKRERTSSTRYSNGISIYSSFVRIEGLQIKANISAADTHEINYLAGTDNGKGYFFNNIISAVFSGTANGYAIRHNWGAVNNRTMYAYNNIISDFINGEDGGGILSNAGSYSVYYNNTVYNCGNGLGGGSTSSKYVLMKNNLAYNNVNNYWSNVAAGSINNLSYPAQTETDTNVDTVGTFFEADISFVDETNKDFHLANADTGARGNGVNLMNDAYFSFQNDIDGEERSGNWDLGADEFNAGLVNSTNISDGLVAVNASQTDKMKNGLVLMQSFDGQNMDWSQTSAEARDQSGQNNHGNVINATPTMGKIGQALSFNGTSSQVTIANTTQAINSVSFWVKSSSSTGAMMDLDLGTHGIFSNAGTITASGFSEPTIYVNGVVSSTISELAWQHITITTATPITLNNPIIGNISIWWYSGLMDEVRFYDRVLSADEIGDLYRMGQVKYRK